MKKFFSERLNWVLIACSLLPLGLLHSVLFNDWGVTDKVIGTVVFFILAGVLAYGFKRVSRDTGEDEDN